MAKVLIPDHCEICGSFTGVAWDVHMVLAHPETRPKPEARPVEPKKKSGTKKKW